MKIVHVAPFTPHQCGLYETAREMIEYENKNGVEAYLYDPRPSEKELKEIYKDHPEQQENPNMIPRAKDWSEDRGICTVPFSVLEKCDYIISHSGLNPKILKLNKPFIHIAHGRPYSSFLIERDKETPIYTFYATMNEEPNFKACVTLWKEFVPYLELLFGKGNVESIESSVDLNRFKINLEQEYDFHGFKDDINFVCTDIWRKDKDPYHVINAFYHFINKYDINDAKLHIYAAHDIQGWKVLINKLKNENIIGAVLPAINGIENIYQAADCLLTPHKIATRSIREALACGASVVAGHGNRFAPYTADEENLDEYAEQIKKAYDEVKTKDKKQIKERNRKIAENNFNIENNIKDFISLINKLRGNDA